MSDESTPVNGDTATTDEATLREQLAKAEQQRDEYLGMLKASRAEFENYQKRAAREREQELRYAQRPLAGDLLTAFDNLDRAVAAARQSGDNSPLSLGVAAVVSQFLDAFRRHGITPIEAAPGTPFDPNLHEAVMQQPTADQEPNTVVQVLQHGFRYHDRVLRPASVIVATKAD